MKVLLVTHEASRTGAPRIAVMIARAVGDSSDRVSVTSRTPGPLLQEFSAIARTRVEPLFRLRRKLWHLRRSRIARALDTVIAYGEILRSRADVVYINSSAAAVYARPANRLGRRVILHLHESGPLAQSFLDRAALSAPLTAGITVVACSPTVREEAAQVLGRRIDDIRLLPSVPQSRRASTAAEQAPDTHCGPADLVVGACGAAEYRKGTDLWIEIARLVLARMPERSVRFVWVGERSPGLDLSELPEQIIFAGPTDDPYPYLQRFDVMTLTSRDDPFPLVVLEAMSVGTPVIAFRTGGVPLQIGDAGVLVEPGDLQGFADQLVELLSNHDLRTGLGEAARHRQVDLYSEDSFERGLLAVLVT